MCVSRIFNIRGFPFNFALPHTKNCRLLFWDWTNPSTCKVSSFFHAWCPNQHFLLYRNEKWFCFGKKKWEHVKYIFQPYWELTLNDNYAHFRVIKKNKIHDSNNDCLFLTSSDICWKRCKTCWLELRLHNHKELYVQNMNHIKWTLVSLSFISGETFILFLYLNGYYLFQFKYT